MGGAKAMGATKKLKKAMVERKMTMVQLADKLGKPFTTVRNTMYNDNMRISTLEEYADALGCDVVLRDRETGELYY